MFTLRWNAGMSRWVALLAVLVVGCSHATSGQVGTRPTPGVAAVTTPTAGEEPSPSPRPLRSPIAVATAIPDLPITTLDFSCRLPFSWDDATNNDFFLTIPSGEVALD